MGNNSGIVTEYQSNNTWIIMNNNGIIVDTSRANNRIVMKNS